MKNQDQPLKDLQAEKSALEDKVKGLVEALESIASKTFEKVDVVNRTYYEWPTKEARIAQKALAAYRERKGV